MSYIGLSQAKLKCYTKQTILNIGECDSLKDNHPEDYNFFV